MKLQKKVMEAVATARVRFIAAEGSENSPSSSSNRSSGHRRHNGGAISLHNKLSALCFTLLQRDWGEGDVK